MWMAVGGNRICASEAAMSLTFFLALCILGCDFLLYVLFQWVYGEKHRKHARRARNRKVSRQSLPAGEAREGRVLSFSPAAMRSRTGFY